MTVVVERKVPQSRTLGGVWREAAGRLREAGVEEADADAELLLLRLLGASKAALLRDWREPFPASREREWEFMLARRSAGEPVQYVVGEQVFFGRAFQVSEAVLIPRPETELLAEAVLAAADRLWPEAAQKARADGGRAAISRPGPAGNAEEQAGAGSGSASGNDGTSVAGHESNAAAPCVLDVGTGSGALAVTLAAERPLWRVTASDLSAAALEQARLNAERHGAADRIRFVQGDLLEPFAGDSPAVSGAVDILVSNPPYIRSADIVGLQREVRDHEPLLALDGGADGLVPYRRMCAQLRQFGRRPRLVAFEVGAGQAEAVAALLAAVADWREVRFIRDYAGIDRHVLAWS